jgi:UDP-glucose 4-epimerase
VIPLFIQALTAGHGPVIHGDGQQSRDFTFVEDVVQANLLAAEAPGASGKVYNVACGKRTTLLELIGHLNHLLGSRIAPSHVAARAGDVRHSQADIERARRELGYRPTTEVFRGLERCLEWWQGRAAGRERATVAA